MATNTRANKHSCANHLAAAKKKQKKNKKKTNKRTFNQITLIHNQNDKLHIWIFNLCLINM